MKRILILGAGRMGAWLVEELCHDYDVAVFDIDAKKMKYFFNVTRLTRHEMIKDFNPEMVINAVTLHKTIPVFEEILPLLDKNCILSDITSVKTGLKDFYAETGFRFVSTHPMFGPTFSNIRDLRNENAIIITDSCPEGIEFFRTFYGSLNLNISEYSFEGHDKTTAYSLSIPFVSSMVFAAVMKKQDAPGSTFKKHMLIAEGLLSEDDYLVSEILFNPNTLEQVEKINAKLSYLIHILKAHDFDEMVKFLNTLRENIK
ncbi:MAG: prephenate dehydrogenase [Spirochaetes bacterium]|nr:prephenate dehydrogenase [Spirochaetota bacterium]